MKDSVWLRILATAIWMSLLTGTLVATAPAPFDYTVPGTFFDMKQPSDMVCWATAATMLRSWKQQTKRDISSVMDEAGPQFRQMFDANRGLSSADKQNFLTAMKLKTEPPATYTGAALLTMLQNWGPLWVTSKPPETKPFSIHARIVVGITSSGSDENTFLTLVDPADGSRHPQSLKDFTADMEAIAKRDYGNSADVRPLIVHF
jgi:hypothetical protein